MGALRLAADFPNLTEVRESLDAIADGLSRALAEGLAQDAAPLLATTKALTPYGPGVRAGADAESDDALGHVRDMLAITVQGGTISIVAAHPAARVLEWGGTIAPRGTPITFTAQAMARRAAVQQLPQIERTVEDRIARLL